MPRHSPAPVPLQAIPSFGQLTLPSPIFPLGTISLGEAFDKRMSEREGGPIDINELSGLLWLSHKGSGRELSAHKKSHRVSPSAGGIHPIELLVINLQHIAPAIFWYQPEPHTLYAVAAEAQAKELDGEARKCAGNAGTVIWLAGSLVRSRAKYHAPESLLLRDAGSLLATISLAAVACGLRSVLIGATGDSTISRLPWKCECVGLGGIVVSK